MTTPQGVANVDPIEYTFRLLTDAYPTIAILSPGANLDVAGDESLPMLFRLTDDYGLSKLRLAYKLVHSRYEQAAADFTFVEIPLAGTGPDRIVPWNWILSTLPPHSRGCDRVSCGSLRQRRGLRSEDGNERDLHAPPAVHR